MAAKTTFVFPCNVYWDADGDNTQIVTEGGVEIRFEPNTVQTKTDATGENIYDEFTNGAVVGITVNACEWDLNKLHDMHGAYSTQTGSDSTSHVEIQADVGTSLRDSAKKVIMKAIVSGAEDTTEEFWVTFPLACPRGPGSIRSDRSAQFVYAVDFAVFPDADNSYRTHWFGLENGS